MARGWRIVLLAPWLAVGCAHVCPVVPEAEVKAFLSARPEEGYVILPGDGLRIEVWQNAQLTRQVAVRPDGKVSLPLVNDVDAAGLSVQAFQTALRDRLTQYLKDPIVSVEVTGFTQKRLFVQGQVRTPAAFSYTGEMYLLQAIAQSGGLTPFSETCAVIVRRKGDGFVRYSVDLDPLLSGTDLKENLLLLPNDVVTVH